MLCNLSYVTNIVFLCFKFLPERSNWLRRCCTTFPNVAVAMRRRPSMVSLYFLLAVETRVISNHWNHCHSAGSVSTTTLSKRSWCTRNRSACASFSKMLIAASRRSSRFSWPLKIWPTDGRVRIHTISVKVQRPINGGIKGFVFCFRGFKPGASHAVNSSCEDGSSFTGKPWKNAARGFGGEKYSEHVEHCK